MVAARDLQETIAIQTGTPTPDSAGGRSVAWATTYTVRAQVRNVRGAEREVHGQRRTLETYLITIRRMDGLTTALRVVWGSKVMNINHIRGLENSRSDFLLLECEVGVRA